MNNCRSFPLIETFPVHQFFSSMERVSLGTVLIIDDTPDNLRVLIATLTRRGYDVSVATSGELALARIQDIMPDLILLDIRMADMDGYQVCERLKSQSATRSIPVIFISAVYEVLDKVRAFEVGAADYITKPIQLEETLVRIEHQLRIRSLQKRLEEQNVLLQQEVLLRRQTEQQLEFLSASLEQQVQMRTAQLEQAYQFEATLKRITDRVRDSLDEAHILQTAIQELAQAIGSESCNAALYDLEQQTSTVCYEYTTTPAVLQGRVLEMANFAKGYEQLLQGQYFQFCSLQPHPARQQPAMLACPILDDHGVLGDLWLVNGNGQAFSTEDIRLVQLVANQCAIAVRQARLYQTAQSQVEELNRLNQLKDDFLSTISHELRTPLSNIHLAIQMLELVLQRLNLLNEDAAPARYLTILNEECQREISLINDLLDLSRLDAGTEPLILSTANLQDWIAHIIESFEGRIRLQQQELQVEIAPDLPPITTDFIYLRHILMELLHNACKYTPAGGVIRVVAEKVPISTTAQELVGNSETGAVFVQISVNNSGVEIPVSEWEKVFDRFYRVPTNDPWRYGGIGLGLALVKKRVEQLRGTISVSSKDDWTSFTVTLPQTIEQG